MKRSRPVPARPTAEPQLHPLDGIAALICLSYSQCLLQIVLIPQTGSWVAESVVPLISLVLAGLGAAAAPGIRSPPWLLLACPGALLSLPITCKWWGRAFLSPGLDSESGALSMVGLLARTGLTAAACGGPILILLGWITATSFRGVPLPRVSGLAAAATAAGLHAGRQLPLPPWPTTTIPLALAACMLARALIPHLRSRVTPRTLYLVAGACLASALFLAQSRAASGRAGPCPGAPGFSVLSSAAARWDGNLVAVIEGTTLTQPPARFRLLRLGHSIMGGVFLAPAQIAGHSVYSAFHLQLAGAAIVPGGRRSLHIGLGAGTAVRGMQRAGVVADVLELHPEILTAASAAFGLIPKGLGSTDAGLFLAGDALATASSLPNGTYDYIIHDVFAGGEVAGPLVATPFLRLLASKLRRPRGILAVNFYGEADEGLLRLACSLRSVLPHLAVLADEEEAAVRNHVLLASWSAVDPGAATPAAAAALCEDQGCAKVLAGLPSRHLPLPDLEQRCAALDQGRAGGGGGRSPSFRGWVAAGRQAADHWSVMRMQIPDPVWRCY
ncbi:hypothetical protein ACKKBF_B11370 [Auxenochlorella protothecoides x Auxenochlorella symbiontica]